MSSTRTIALAIVCGVCFASPASAQRDQIKDLLRDLIESQLRKDKRNRNSRGQGRTNLGPGRTNLGPGRIAPGTGRPPAKRMAGEDLKRLNRLRPLAAQYVDASARLVGGMNDDLGQAPVLRTLIPRALQLNATAAALTKRLDGNVTADYVTTQLQQLDQQHRQLGFQINQIQPVPGNCRTCLAELDGLRDRVGGIYGVQPQLNLAGIAELSGALNVTLDALVEDVGVELRSNKQWRTLVQDGRRLQSQCRSFRFSCAEAGGRDTLVDEFNTYLTLWRPYSDRLESFNNPYLARGIRRSHDLNRQISEQLMIPVTMDRTRARHLAELIDTEFKSLCGFIDLNVLNLLPNPQALPPMAKQLRVQTQGFRECVPNNESLGQMRRRWRELHETWTRFSYELTPIRNQRIRTIAGQLDGSVLALRDVLGIVPKFDLARIRRVASNVDSLSSQLSAQADRWARRGDAGRVVQTDLRKFHTECQDFHNTTLGRIEGPALLKRCDSVVASWHRVVPKIMKCESPEAVAMNRLSEQLTLNLVQLETLLQ